MNIHFTDETIFKNLLKATLVNIDIGSTMYGTSDNSSDIDRIHIYVPNIEDDLSFTSTHHQFQYKTNGIDYLFINIHDFLRNSLNGDSTINYEVIMSDSLKHTNLNFLYEIRNAFSNYKIVRSYLGLCKRDIKFLNKGGTTERDKNKKLGHILRGYRFAKLIMENKFSPYISGSLLEEIYDMKSFDYKQRTIRTGILTDKISLFRANCNKLLDSGELGLPIYMSISNQKLLDKNLKELTDSEEWKERKLESLGLLDLIYNVNENDINYH